MRQRPATIALLGWAALAACSGATAQEASAPAPTATATTVASAGGAREAGPTADPPAADAGAPSEGDASLEMNVAGRRPDDDAIDVTGSSDLPPGAPSTAQPYERLIAAAVAPIRAALAECLRPLGAPARRRYRVVVRQSGQLAPRPPQPLALPDRVARCAEGVVRGTRVDPPPSMDVPYDIALDIAP